MRFDVSIESTLSQSSFSLAVYSWGLRTVKIYKFFYERWRKRESGEPVFEIYVLFEKKIWNQSSSFIEILHPAA
jgi:hypothetical protein